jgi:hypothetical protein
MKLFRRHADAAKPVNQPVVSSSTVPQEIPAEPVSAGIKQSFDAIALSAEQEEILKKPIDPRVLRILHELHADKSAAEAVLKAGSIIQFPQNELTGARVVQDENGFWRIVGGPALEQDRSMGQRATVSIPI